MGLRETPKWETWEHVPGFPVIPGACGTVAHLNVGHQGTYGQGCQMANFDPLLSLDCARVEGEGAQSKERKGSNSAICQPCNGIPVVEHGGGCALDLLVLRYGVLPEPLCKCLKSLDREMIGTRKFARENTGWGISSRTWVGLT